MAASKLVAIDGHGTGPEVGGGGAGADLSGRRSQRGSLNSISNLLRKGNFLVKNDNSVRFSYFLRKSTRFERKISLFDIFYQKACILGSPGGPKVVV